MRIYFSQYVKYQDGSKPVLFRCAFGDGLRSSLKKFLTDFLPYVCNLIISTITHGNLATKVDDDVKSVCSARFVITLKF